MSVFTIDLIVSPSYFSIIMKLIKLSVLALACSTLSSCSLAQSALKLPGSILTAAGRTVGLPISHEEAPKTEAEKQEEEEQKIY